MSTSIADAPVPTPAQLADAAEHVADLVAAGHANPTTADEFLAANPRVWGQLILHAMRALAASKSGKISINDVFEQVRKAVEVTTDGQAGAFKINNSYRARCARKLANEIPELRNAFRFRASVADAGSGAVEVPAPQPRPTKPCVFGATSRPKRRTRKLRAGAAPPPRALRPGEPVAFPKSGIQFATVKTIGVSFITMRDQRGRIRKVLRLAEMNVERLQLELPGVTP